MCQQLAAFAVSSVVRVADREGLVLRVLPIRVPLAVAVRDRSVIGVVDLCSVDTLRVTGVDMNGQEQNVIHLFLHLHQKSQFLADPRSSHDTEGIDVEPQAVLVDLDGFFEACAQCGCVIGRKRR